jgi:hypothetical protein
MPGCPWAMRGALQQAPGPRAAPPSSLEPGHGPSIQICTRRTNSRIVSDWFVIYLHFNSCDWRLCTKEQKRAAVISAEGTAYTMTKWAVYRP